MQVVSMRVEDLLRRDLRKSRIRGKVPRGTLARHRGFHRQRCEGGLVDSQLGGTALSSSFRSRSTWNKWKRNARRLAWIVSRGTYQRCGTRKMHGRFMIRHLGRACRGRWFHVERSGKKKLRPAQKGISERISRLANRINNNRSTWNDYGWSELNSRYGIQAKYRVAFYV